MCGLVIWIVPIYHIPGNRFLAWRTTIRSRAANAKRWRPTAADTMISHKMFYIEIFHY
jgi:hypothetical protein